MVVPLIRTGLESSPRLVPTVFDEIVSLGATCQTAQQIRSHFGRRGSHVFDWMFSSFEGVIGAIQADFDGVFDLGRLRVRQDRYTVDVVDAGLSLHHLFPRDDAGLIIPEAVALTYDDVRSKLDYLVGKWRGAYAARTLYVVQLWDTADLKPRTADLRRELRRLSATLRSRRNDDFVILAVSSDEAAEPDWEQDGIVHRSLRLHADVERWEQNRPQWARAFDEVAVRGPRTATGRVLQRAAKSLIGRMRNASEGR